jgi:hypothetical protein
VADVPECGPSYVEGARGARGLRLQLRLFCSPLTLI